MMHEVRTHAADAARNRAAMEALDRYFRLADAEARGQVLRDAVPNLDEIRSDVKSAREKGLRVPLEPADLDRQRATLIGLVGQSDLAVAVLNIELKRRIGHPGGGPDRLWPVGPFSVSAAPIDVEAGVRVALERRGDLRMLRAVHARLTPETLTAVREVLGEKVREHVPDPLAGFPHLKRLADRRRPQSSASPSAETLAELATFRQHLADQIAAKEREAADDVRSAAAAVTAAVHQVALANWQAEQLAAKAADAAERGPLAEKPARLEALQARADVAGAVYAWHAARVRLLAAQGVLPDPAP